MHPTRKRWELAATPRPTGGVKVSGWARSILCLLPPSWSPSGTQPVPAAASPALLRAPRACAGRGSLGSPSVCGDAPPGAAPHHGCSTG